MAYYDGSKQTPTRACMYTLSVIMFITLGYLLLILVNVFDGGIFTFYYWIYSLAFVKIGVTVLKYIPQIYLNFVRRSTEGWNITQILLDLMGGLFSALQLGRYNEDIYNCCYYNAVAIAVAMALLTMLFMWNLVHAIKYNFHTFTCSLIMLCIVQMFSS